MQTDPNSARASSAPVVDSWRSELLDAALGVLSVGLCAMAVVLFALFNVPRFGVPLLAVIGAAGVAIAMRLARTLPPVVRSGSASLATLGGGMVVIAYGGLGPGVPLALAVIAAVLSIAIGRGVALLYLGLSAAGFAVIGVLVVTGRLPLPPDVQDPLRWTTWFRWALVFLISAGVLTWIVHAMVTRIEQSARARALADAEQHRCTEVLLELAKHPALGEGDLVAAFAAITEAGVRALDVTHTGVWLFEDDGASLRCRDQFDRMRGHERGVTLRAAESPRYFAALAGGRALATADARTDERTRELLATYLEPQGVTAMLDVPIRSADRLVGVLCHEQVGETRQWSAEAEACAASLGDLAALALAAAERRAREQELRVAYELLGKLHCRVENAKEAERRHLARELHDELGQSLTALKLRLQLAGPQSSDQLPLALAIVDDLIDRTRRLSLDLRPPLLDEAGLAAAVRADVERNAELAGVEVALDTAGLGAALAPELETAAFRVVQESLTNVVRHADARHVDVALRVEGERLHIRVCDDGRGFDLAVVGGGRHFGVLGMTERVRGLGGTFAIESRPGRGTTVDASLPLAQHD